MKRIIKIKNTYGTYDKYVLVDEYNNFGIYEEKTPSGYFVNQSWLISNNENAELVVEPYNDLCKEELLDIIDNYNKNKKFGIKATSHNGLLYMHPCGRLV